MSNTPVARAVRWVRSQVRGVPAHTLIWTIVGCSATICLLQLLQNQKRGSTVSQRTEKAPGASSDHRQTPEQQTADEEEKDGDDSVNEEQEEEDGRRVEEREALEDEEEEK